MPTSRSSTKRVRQNETKRLANRAGMSRLANFRKKFDAAVSAKDKTRALEAFRKYCGLLDKAAKSGLIKQNNADRHKSRAARRLKTLA